MSTAAFSDSRGPYELLVDLHAQVAEIKEMLEKQPRQVSSAGWLNAKSAAKYLDVTEDALRAAVKRRQLMPHRTETGGLRFRREELDAFASGGDAR